MKKTNLFLISILFSTNIIAADLETEPNNEMEDANQITPGVKFSGQIINYENDWFFFETNQKDVLTINLENASERKVISVYDADNNILYQDVLGIFATSNKSTSTKIGLGHAGKFFLKVHASIGHYDLTLNLENQLPYTPTTTYPGNAKFSGFTGVLELPAVDVANESSGFVTYNAKMKLVPSTSGKLTFELTEASANK